MEWLLRTIGVTDEVLEHLEEAELAFQRPAMLWVGLLVLAITGWYVYRRQEQCLGTVSRRGRLLLTATRVIIVAILLFALSGPYLKIDIQVAHKPVVAILVDTSTSMQLPAGPFDSDKTIQRIASVTGLDDAATIDGGRQAVNDLSRAELAERVLITAWPAWVNKMAQRFDVRFYVFADRASPLALDTSRAADLDLSPNGSATHVGEAIHGVLEEVAGRTVAGILLLSDGQNTGGRSPAQAARTAMEARAPVFAIPLGSDHGLHDLSVIDAYTPGLVAVGDTVSVHATLESQGFEGRAVRVELRDGDQLLDARECITHDTEHQQVELTFEATAPGTRYLTVHVPPQEEESPRLLTNNSDTTSVRITGEKLRVLFLDGRPRWDFRFVKNAIRRDHGLTGRSGTLPDIVVESEWCRMNQTRQSRNVPNSLDEIANYHTIILGDVSPKLLTREFQAVLADAVRTKGVGLIVQAGTEFMPHRFGFEFQELLPVRCSAAQAGREAPVYNPFYLEVSPEGLIHEAMRLYDDPGRNQLLWARMPPYYWCAAVERAAPGATVLAWNPSLEGRFGKMPLIAYHFAGEGKVMFLATDSTWLWRQNVGDRYFYKFWGQAIRFVSRRDEEATGSWLEVRPVRAQPGEETQVVLMAHHSDGTPIEAPLRTVSLLGPGEPQSLKLTADPIKPGRFVGKFTPAQSGAYRIIYQPPGDQETVEARMQVLPSPAEFRHPSVNRPALQTLAKTSGGRLVEVTDVARILPELEGETVIERLHRESAIWDNWLVLLVVVMVYILDVGVRRFMGLS